MTEDPSGRLTVDIDAPGRDVRLALAPRPGRITAVIGPNGAGKSTLLGAIAGSVPVRGSIHLDGAEVISTPPHRRGVTYLQQDPVLFSHLSLRENVAFGPLARGLPRRLARERADELLAEVGLDSLGDRRPREISGGQAQRAALARALAIDPLLVLLDEPLAALDAEAAPRLRSLLRVLLEGRTALLVTHDLVDVLTLAEDVAVLEDGRLVAVGPRERILARPPTAFAARLVGKVLLTGRIDGRRLRLPDGAVVPGQIEGDLRDGDAAYALIDPATVELEVPGRRPDPEAGRTGHVAVADEIIGLDRIGARILVRGRHLAVEVPAETLLHTDLGSGTAVRFLIDPASTPLYPG